MSVRQDRLDLARDLLADGRTPAEVTAVLRATYGINGRVAARLARGWSQADAAAAWTSHWPDEPKTFKSISYWETWPGPTGHAPSLAVLDRLAQLYGCAVADLITGWGEHGPPRPEPAAAEPATLAWQVSHLDLPELTRSIADWSERLAPPVRRALLLKLSTAAAAAAGPASGARRGSAPRLAELAGQWDSSYSFVSTGRGTEFTGRHRLSLEVRRGRLTGRSLPTATGLLELDLTIDGQLVNGTWTERTTPGGYYRGAVYHGLVQLVLDPAGRSMVGMWLGPDKAFAVNAGPWTLQRA